MSTPDIPVMTDAARDVRPPAAATAACRTCGKELDYSGTGRRPLFCEAPATCKADARAAAGPKKSHKAVGQSAQLAAQATEALVQVNALISMGLMLTRMPQTAMAMAAAEDGFRESTYAALLTDPGLCRTILKAGTTGGKVALGVSYAMLGAAVAPVGVLEFKANRADAGEVAPGEDRPEQ